MSIKNTKRYKLVKYKSTCYLSIQFEMIDEFFKENGSRRLIFFYQDMKVCAFNYFKFSCDFDLNFDIC